MKCIWQRDDRPAFTWNESIVDEKADACSRGNELPAGDMESMPEPGKVKAMIDFMASEAVKNSEIEGNATAAKTSDHPYSIIWG